MYTYVSTAVKMKKGLLGIIIFFFFMLSNCIYILFFRLSIRAVLTTAAVARRKTNYACTTPACRFIVHLHTANIQYNIILWLYNSTSWSSSRHYRWFSATTA